MRIVSGMRPTGKLHLGHYLGVLKNWVELQKENECFFFVADWHALSTSYEDKLNLKNLSIELVRDWIAAGIDPQKSTIFIQSAIKEHAELYVLLNMITPLGWLERNPTYKDQLAQIKNKDIHTAGFLTYPVLQTADIVLYDAQAVPIGEDQKPHLEIAREIVRRFHHLFECEVFTEPKELLSPTPRLLGLDGRKMSKSYNNAIFLSDTPEEVWNKLRVAKTDPQRVKRTDPGNPEVCLIYDYHKAFSDEETIQKVEEGCRSAGIGCVECKKWCAASIEKVLEPMRERRESVSNEDIAIILQKGEQKAKQEAAKKMQAVNKAIFEVSCQIQ
ncbi:tryptophanyl-tRNA synthetase [Nitratiruptor sp. YY08-26]|uniref:tryptophan--tRNA ligase n=1 Tax=unclassified Nitratiruptor TaxID=2624044 RepID=UPI001916795A|nr:MULTISPECIES: tryptophan--tRNA ligase [unclassified Nitratiruptor]BCD62692.1 tryptophanyl-tRNA synthetase [Nitratiruptor sp. YY08-13]BCD66628.1 tryptophanyl-tRNA synthetase [Nitratiruptor sp. YY08-26]